MAVRWDTLRSRLSQTPVLETLQRDYNLFSTQLFTFFGGIHSGLRNLPESSETDADGFRLRVHESLVP